MERKTQKAINFDLDTDMLKFYYSRTTGKAYNNAYYEIRSFMEKNGFKHRQGSGYVSERKIDTYHVYALCDRLNEQFPWLGNCVNKFDVTNISKTYDLTSKLKGSSAESVNYDNAIDDLNLVDEYKMIR